MSAALISSPQPLTFAMPAAFYDLAETTGRCICGDTIRLRQGEWTHPGTGSVWCRRAWDAR